MSVIGIDELWQQLEPVPQPGGRLLEVAGTPRHVGERRERVRAKPDVGEPLRYCVQPSRGCLVLSPKRNCGERPGMRRRVFFGKVERTIDPLVDDLPVWSSLPHAGPSRRLQRKFRIELGRGAGELYRLLDRRTERFAVKYECVRATDPQPKLGLLA